MLMQNWLVQANPLVITRSVVIFIETDLYARAGIKPRDTAISHQPAFGRPGIKLLYHWQNRRRSGQCRP